MLQMEELEKLDERAITFLKKYAGEKVYILDAKSLVVI